MNPISFNPNFGRILLLSTALIVSINTIAGGRSSERNLMDDYLQDKTSAKKSFLFTPVAPRLKTKALLLMNADRCKGIAEALGFADVLSCK
jgi:hypothetical protein